jgi:aerobic-type carbon monoxide dehydrogenase small subunit (CoxS/CutS family)
MVKHAKLRSYSTATKFKSGYQVARNFAEAVRLDERNVNSKWQEAVDLDLQEIYKYYTFVVLGHHTSAKVPQ